MDKLRIKGGNRLQGQVRISGAKNSALPAMAASLLTSQEVILQNLPLVNDVFTTRRLLRELGATVEFEQDHSARLHAQKILSHEAPYDLVKTMRASVLVLGPLLARTGRARVSLPGGCAIGARPINLHINGLQKLGAIVRTAHGYVEASAERLSGTDILFDKVTVTGTENLMMAATLAEGKTVLQNAACEPEVGDLAEMLNEMGAHIKGAGTPEITIEGVRELNGTTHRIIPDRIETGTFLIAGAITNGDLEIVDSEPAHLGSIIQKLRDTGAQIETGAGRMRVRGNGDLWAADVVTKEYPGFATDMQAQYMALMTQAVGTSVITEDIFENRFMHASELMRMGAVIRIDGARAIVTGKTPLSGATVIASDLRASASLVIAGLVADGATLIDRVYHLDRGYEKIEEKLRSVGAQIDRLK
ncbi:MAG: UDP-N-acetylglucosamine 1-carboxyvinyltransferase [Acidobacteria bacterium]|nr:MAG: UDP-N-acetylglucosamine 1-carboxyvinyltransferase [Acidobacteriota bacterium]